MRFSNKERMDVVRELTSVEHDVLIIGGGITGAGIALDGTTRGMKMALVEMQDFAAGTSSRSTKLVHGGLRYLKSFEVGLVAEVGKERAIVYENGPHVTTPEWMLLPFHEGGTYGKFMTSIGLRMYDFLAGVKKSERRKMLTAEETLEREPLVKREGLKGGGRYVEYKTDDARLTIEVMKAAAEHGALCLNYAKVEELLYENGICVGAKIKDLATGEELEVKARKIINATGPWVDRIRELDKSKQGKMLRLSKGIHIVIDQSKFPLRQAVYFDTPDGRMVFAIPRDNKTYVGTTDTFYDEDIINPSILTEDREYLIKAIRYMFPDVDITTDDIESSWSGVRPLIYEEGKSASEISRKDEIWESPSGLITIAGGKLTGYRKMAETVVDLVAKKFAKEGYRTFSPSQTMNLPMSGGNVGGSAGFKKYLSEQTKAGVELGLTEEESRQLVATYGSNVPIVFEIIKNERTEAEKYGLPVTVFGQLKYALEQEMVLTPVDFLNRRTGMILFNISLAKSSQAGVVDYMADYFNWNPKTKEKYAKELQQAILDATVPFDEQ